MLLGAFWVPLGRSWVPLGASWAPLGALLGGLGPLLGGLGALLGGLGAVLERHAKIIQKSTSKIPSWAPQTPPKWHQNRIEKRPQIDAKNKRKKNPKKIVLRPSWGDLGSFWFASWTRKSCFFSLVFKAFREHSLFSNNIVSRAVLNRTWSQKPPKMTSQNG